MAVVLAIDAGTTGVRTIAFDGNGRPVDTAYRELTQHFPRPGWVEHDPAQIWSEVAATLAEVTGRLRETPAAIGITNQRETALAWDRRTGRPLHRAIVWQDRRTAARCEELAAAGHLPTVRRKTGLVLDSYFSATKWEWLLGPGGVPGGHEGLALGTVDSWVLWNLTGGPKGGVFATDPSNASRTLVYDIRNGTWDGELADLFGVPADSLPEVLPSSGRFGATAGGIDGVPAGIPVSGIAGDQQAALFGQACFEAGMTKNTYGTGSFVLMNVGQQCPEPSEGLLTTVAWDLHDPRGGAARTTTYALEGAVFVTGAALQWLRDGLGIIDSAADAGPLAAGIPDSEGVYFVPALAGMGSPWWDPDARGLITGITRGSGRAHLVRAAVEAMAYQARDVVEAMSRAAGRQVAEMRVDGGASVMDVLLQLQADQLRVPVARADVVETTARGAAWLAGLAEGVWSGTDELADQWSAAGVFRPSDEPDETSARAAADTAHAGWTRAVERARGWARRDQAGGQARDQAGP